MTTEERNENLEEVEETVENTETTETEEEVVEEKTAEELLQEKVDKLEEELKQSEDKYLRLYAEFENFKRRKNQEIETNNIYKSQKVITEILPSLDNLERALQVDSDNEEIKSLLNMVSKEMELFRETKSHYHKLNAIFIESIIYGIENP